MVGADEKRGSTMPSRRIASIDGMADDSDGERKSMRGGPAGGGGSSGEGDMGDVATCIESEAESEAESGGGAPTPTTDAEDDDGGGDGMGEV